MKLGTKLYLFFAGIVILPLLVVTVISSIVLARSEQGTYRTRMQSSLAAAAAILSEEQRSAGDALVAALRSADTSALISGNSPARAAQLDSIRGETGASEVLLERGGQTLAVSGSAPGGEAQLKTAVNLSGAGSSWQVTALKTVDSSSISGVFSLQGLEWGILEGGKVISGTLAGGSFRTSSGASVSAAPGAPGGSTFDARAGGSDLLALALSLPATLTSKPLVMVAAAPASAVGAASSRALAAGLILTFLTLALAVVLGILLSRKITGPLRRVNQAAAAGAAGDLGREVKVNSRDEIGSLAASFNLMQANIRSYVKELEESRSNIMLALSYAGDILGATSDRMRLIKTTAEAARLATGALAVWVELFADAGSPGHKAMSAGAPRDYFEGERSRQATAVADDIGTGRIEPGEIIDLPGDLAAIGYPLRHGREALGSLLAMFSGREALTGQSQRILESLATQAASAVDNVNFAELQKMLAVTDPMTGISNFRSFQDRLSREVDACRRYGRELSLAIIDLDDFKHINDKFGHQIGDELLKGVARALAGRVRQVDIVARYGGEEFAVIFPETPMPAAMKVAESLRGTIEDLTVAGNPEVRVTASIGVAAFPDDAADEKDLIGKADLALYQAKAMGKNRVVS